MSPPWLGRPARGDRAVLRVDQGAELLVGEVLCRHEGPCPDELFWVLAGGDAYGWDACGDRGGDARDRVLEGQCTLGRDASLLQRGSIRCRIRLYGFDVVG